MGLVAGALAATLPALGAVPVAFGQGLVEPLASVLGDDGTAPAASPDAPAAAPVGAPTAPQGFAYGMQAHLYYQNVPAVLGLVTDAGFGWVKQQVRWADTEPVQGAYQWDELDKIVASAVASGVHVLFSVVTAPAWSRASGTTDGPPDDYTAFATFLTALATRYVGQVNAYEIWNEQNFSREWGGGQINAGEYVELLKVAYPAIKAADPNAVVITGALTPTGFNDPAVAIDDVAYLDQMYAYQDGVLKNICDAIGAHAGGFNNPPDDTADAPTVKTTTFKGHPSFYFRRLEQLRGIMVLAGDSEHKMWVTEFGWSTANQAKGYEYGKDNTAGDQANYLVRAYQLARDWGWVDGMFVWNLNFQQIVPTTDEKFPFGIVGPDGTPRPAYTALKLMEKLP